MNLRTEIYLVGTVNEKILGAELPSNRQVLSVFFYKHNISKLTIRESAKFAIREASLFWTKCRIPIKAEHNSITKLLKIFKEWQNICKSIKRRHPAQIKREIKFEQMLDSLFDISSMNALEVMENEVDKQFLINQRRKGRPGCIAGVDTKVEDKARTQKRRAEIAMELATSQDSSVRKRKSRGQN